jgi:hypothetical protein
MSLFQRSVETRNCDKEVAMEKDKVQTAPHTSAPSGKKPWQEPKLAFVEPKLTKHGSLEKVTGQTNGFFQEFSP